MGSGTGQYLTTLTTFSPEMSARVVTARVFLNACFSVSALVYKGFVFFFSLLNRMARSSASSPGSHLLWKINSSDCCALEIMKTSSPLVFGKVLSHFLLM